MKKVIFTFAIMLMALGANAQMKIVSGHPDLRVKFVRCVASDKTVVMDLIFYNESSKDVRMEIGGGRCNIVGQSQVFDDDANVYSGYDVRVSIGNNELTTERSYQNFPSETALKVRAQISNVSLSATEFVRFDMIAYCEDLNIRKMKFTHIPITRE